MDGTAPIIVSPYTTSAKYTLMRKSNVELQVGSMHTYGLEFYQAFVFRSIFSLWAFLAYYFLIRGFLLTVNCPAFSLVIRRDHRQQTCKADMSVGS